MTNYEFFSILIYSSWISTAVVSCVISYRLKCIINLLNKIRKQSKNDLK